MYPRKRTCCWWLVSTMTAAEQCWKHFKSFCPPARTVFSNISGSLIKIRRGTDSTSLVLTAEWALVQTAAWLQKPSSVLCALDVSWKWLLSQKTVCAKLLTIYTTPSCVSVRTGQRSAVEKYKYFGFFSFAHWRCSQFLTKLFSDLHFSSYSFHEGKEEWLRRWQKQYFTILRFLIKNWFSIKNFLDRILLNFSQKKSTF